MGNCNVTDNINLNDCIGDAFIKTNENFENIENALCNLFLGLSGLSGIDVESVTSVDLSGDYPEGTAFVTFNVKLKNGGGLRFNNKEIELTKPIYDHVAGDGIEISANGDDNIFSVKLKEAGGLEFDSDGSIKLTPSSTMFYVAIRPSDPNSTDDSNVSRTATDNDDPNVMVPYFVTLQGALSYVRNNISGNVVIFVDEDCYLTKSYVFSSTSSLDGRYITADELSLAGKVGYEEGLYVWNRNWNVPDSVMLGGTGTVVIHHDPYTLSIQSRYLFSDNKYYPYRKFNQAPNKIKTNIFISSNPEISGGNGDLEDFDFGSSFDEWTNPLPKYTDETKTTGTRYGTVAPRPISIGSSGSKIDLINVNFSINTNGNDCSGLIIRNSNVTIRNSGMIFNGRGVYEQYFLNIGSSTVTIVGEQLYDPSLTDNANLYTANKKIWPGYGISFTGDEAYPINTNGYFYVMNSKLENIDRGTGTRSYGYNSLINGSYIFSGKINTKNGLIVNVGENSVIVDVNNWFEDDLTLTSKYLSASTLSSFGYDNDYASHISTKGCSMAIGYSVNYPWSFTIGEFNNYTSADRIFTKFLAKKNNKGNLSDFLTLNVHDVPQYPVVTYTSKYVNACDYRFTSYNFDGYADEANFVSDDDAAFRTDTLSAFDTENIYKFGAFTLAYK